MIRSVVFPDTTSRGAPPHTSWLTHSDALIWPINIQYPHLIKPLFDKVLILCELWITHDVRKFKRSCSINSISFSSNLKQIVVVTFKDQAENNRLGLLVEMLVATTQNALLQQADTFHDWCVDPACRPRSGPQSSSTEGNMFVLDWHLSSEPQGILGNDGAAFTAPLFPNRWQNLNVLRVWKHSQLTQTW